jgi:hypothetical protein
LELSAFLFHHKEFEMSPEEIIQWGAVVLAIVFAYIPGVKGWFDKQGIEVKLLIQVGSFILVIGGAFAGSWLGWINVFEPSTSGALAALLLLIKVILFNQGAYQAFVRLPSKIGE